MRLIVLAVVAATLGLGQVREVAITFDDLPRGGVLPKGEAAVVEMNRKVLAALQGIPVTAFVNGERTGEVGQAGLDTVLRLWMAQGAELGNHTATHPDLNRVSVEQYTADIERGEAAVVRMTGKRPRYFRHPFLHAGKDQADKKAVYRYLSEHGYTVAPVTFDNSDWMFSWVYAKAVSTDAALAARVKQEYVRYMESVIAFFEERTREVVGRDIPQILLVHTNAINADAMGELVGMLRRRGYRFVSLGDALKDPAYKLPEEYAGTGGFSWIHRWSKTKGMPGKGEPEEPEWIVKAFNNGN